MGLGPENSEDDSSKRQFIGTKATPPAGRDLEPWDQVVADRGDYLLLIGIFTAFVPENPLLR